VKPSGTSKNGWQLLEMALAPGVATTAISRSALFEAPILVACDRSGLRHSPTARQWPFRSIELDSAMVGTAKRRAGLFCPGVSTFPPRRISHALGSASNRGSEP